MPKPVLPIDATNFRKDGYVSRTQAKRDGAGNIKLYEDTAELTNTTIMVEPVTSQFSVETALKLFETRFEYFKFPVQTVATGSLAKIDESINEEVANSLAGVSFEQDVITRRMELVPLVEGSDVIEWLVPTPWSGINFNDLDSLFKENSKSTLKGNYLNSFKNNVLRTVDNKTVWSGFRRIPMSNGNSPRGNGWLRITPDMLSQLQRGDKLKSTKKPMDPKYAPWKRNIKIKFTISWRPEDNTINSFKGKDGHYADFSGKTANFHSGVCLFVRLVTDPWSDTWNRDETYNEPEQPLFIQSTRDINWSLVPYLQAMIDDTTSKEDRQITHPNQSMSVEYVIDSNELLEDINNDPNITAYRGNYREFALEAISNHPSIITQCVAEISVEELPDDYIDDPGFGWDDNLPKVGYGQYLTKDDVQLKYDQFRSLFGKFTYRRHWFSGVRTIDGKHIIAAQQGKSILAIGGTNKDSNWVRMYNWTGYKWDISKTGLEYTINTNLLNAGYAVNNNFTAAGKLTAAATAFTELDTIVNVKILSAGATQVTTTQDKPASITSLYKVQADLSIPNTRIKGNTKYSGTDYATFPLRYTGGNGGVHEEIVITSTSFPELTYAIPAGKLADGDGKLQGFIRGTTPNVDNFSNDNRKVIWNGKSILGFDITNILFAFIESDQKFVKK